MNLGLQFFFIWCISKYLLRAFAYWERPSGGAESERLCCVYRQMIHCRVVLSDKEATTHWWRPTVAHQTAQKSFTIRTATKYYVIGKLCGSTSRRRQNFQCTKPMNWTENSPKKRRKREISQEGNLFWVAFLFLLDAMTKEARYYFFSRRSWTCQTRIHD